MAGAEAATQSKQTETKTRPRTSTPEVAGMGTVALPYVPSGPLANLPNARMRQEAILNLQRWGGNAMVQRLLQREEEPEEELPPPEPIQSVSGQGEEHFGVSNANGGGPSFSLHGRVEADYNGGSFATSSEVLTRGSGCAGCPPAQCVHVTGTLTTNYDVGTTIIMPGMPDGLTPCQQQKVQDFLDNVLRPHEEEHVGLMEQYNGTTERQFSFTACRSAFEGRIRGLVAAEEVPRRAAAQSASDAIDPFTRTVDLSECEEEEAAPTP